MIATLILVAVSMACKDAFYTTSTYFISRRRPFLAACFDVGGDIASVISIGVTAVLTVQHGISSLTLFAFAALAVGSFIGTFAGVRLATWLSDLSGEAPAGLYR
jgi:hypothetical protein